MRTATPRLALMVALALGAVACSHTPAPTVDPGAPGSEVAVQVQSHHMTDVVISVLHNGVWDRIGTAGAAGMSSFFVPWRLIAGSGTIRLKADPIGEGNVLVSEPLNVRPGELIRWTLESDLERSSIGVF
jgi:hypothetical protein